MRLRYRLSGYEPGTEKVVASILLMPQAANHMLKSLGLAQLDGDLPLTRAQVSNIFKFAGLTLPASRCDWYLGEQAS